MRLARADQAGWSHITGRLGLELILVPVWDHAICKLHQGLGIPAESLIKGVGEAA